MHVYPANESTADTLQGSYDELTPEIAEAQSRVHDPLKDYPDFFSGDQQLSDDQADLDGRMDRLLQNTTKGNTAADELLQHYRDYRQSRGEEEFAYLDTYQRRQTATAYRERLPRLMTMFSGPERMQQAFPEDQRQGFLDGFRESEDPAGDKMQAANLAVVEHALGREIPAEMWPAARNQYANQVLGQAGEVDDAKLYQLLGDHYRGEKSDMDTAEQVARAAQRAAIQSRSLNEALEGARTLVGGDDWKRYEPVVRSSYASVFSRYSPAEIQSARGIFEEMDDAQKSSIGEFASGKQSYPRTEAIAKGDDQFSARSLAHETYGKAGLESRNRIMGLVATMADDEGQDAQGFFSRADAALRSGSGLALSGLRVGIQGDAPFYEALESQSADDFRRGVYHRMADRARGESVVYDDIRSNGIRALEYIDRNRKGFWDSLDDRLLMAIESAPVMATAAAPSGTGLVLLGNAFARQNLAGLRRDHPEMPEDKMNLVAYSAGTAQAALSKLELLTFRARLPFLGDAVAGLGRTGAVLNYVANAGLQTVSQTAEQVLQNTAPVFIQKIAAGVSKDIPGVEVEDALKQEWAAMGDTAGVALIYSLFGSIGATAEHYAGRDQLRATLGDRGAMRLAGLDADTANRIGDLAGSNKVSAALKELQSYYRDTSIDVRRNLALEEKARQGGVPFKEAGIPEIVAGADGTATVHWNDPLEARQVFPDQAQAREAVLGRAYDEAAAIEAFNRRALFPDLGGLARARAGGEVDLATLRDQEAGRLKQSLAKSGIVLETQIGPSTTLAEWAGDSQPRLAQARERVKLELRKAANDMNLVVGDGEIDLGKWFTLGSSQNSYADGLTRISIRLADAMAGRTRGATPLTVLEEVSEGVSKHLRDSGGVPLAKQAGWLREAEANTQQRFLQDDHATLTPELQRQAVDEGFARLALGYATGRVLESQAPSGLRSFLTAFKHLYYETLRLGRDINTWRERGTMDAELHAALKLATGHAEEGDALGTRREGEVMVAPHPSFSISPLPIVREAYRESGSDLRRRIMKDTGPDVRNVYTGWDIGVSTPGVKHIVSQNKGIDRAILPHFKELLEQAIWMGRRSHRDAGLERGIRWQHLFYSPFSKDGLGIARFVVNETWQGERVIDLKADSVKNEEPVEFRAAVQQRADSSISPTGRITVRQLADQVKTLWPQDQPKLRLPENDRRSTSQAGEAGHEVGGNPGDSAGDTSFSIGRSEGRLTLPEVIIGHPLAAATSHADYAAAKGGDTRAALRVADDLVDPAMIEKVRELIGERKPTLVPVMAEESAGRNKIPAGVAVKLARALGLPRETEIKQAVRAHRSDANGLDRVFAPVSFAGEVIPGKEYLLIDDTLTQGGTFAGLADHIISNGGKVIGEIALTGKNYSSKLALTDETLQRVRGRLGDLESTFREATGHGYDALTESEARTLASWKPLDAVRTRILRERDARIDGGDGTNPGRKGGEAEESGLNGSGGGEAPSDTTFSIGSDSGKGFSPDANASNFSKNSNERRNETEASGELSDESEGHRVSRKRAGEGQGGFGGEVSRGEGERGAEHLGDGSESIVVSFGRFEVLKYIRPEGILVQRPDGEVARSIEFRDLQDKVRLIRALGGMPTEAKMGTDGMFLVQERGEPITATDYLSLELPFGIEPAPMRVYRVEINGVPYFVSDLRQENFVKDRSGNIRVIDLIAGRASP